MTAVELTVADEVAAQLTADQLGMLKSGELATHPEYQCWQCGQPGDLRREAAAAVLFIDDARSIFALGWIHGRCGPSAVYPASQMDAWAAAHAEAGQTGTSDEIYTTAVDIEEVRFPALIVVPASNVAGLRSGASTVMDSCVEEMRREGFAPVDLPAGWQRPVQLLRWAVRIKDGNLIAVKQPGGTWWSWTGVEPCRLADEWLAAARHTRRVLLMVTGARLADDDDDEAAFRAALAAASSTGRLVGALVSVHGVGKGGSAETS